MKRVQETTHTGIHYILTGTLVHPLSIVCTYALPHARVCSRGKQLACLSSVCLSSVCPVKKKKSVYLTEVKGASFCSYFGHFILLITIHNIGSTSSCSQSPLKAGNVMHYDSEQARLISAFICLTDVTFSAGFSTYFLLYVKLHSNSHYHKVTYMAVGNLHTLDMAIHKHSIHDSMCSHICHRWDHHTVTEREIEQGRWRDMQT